MNIEKRYDQTSFKYYIENHWIIMVDTCTLMSEGAPAFFSQWAEVMVEAGQKFTIPMRCVDEINRHCKSGDPERTTGANRAIALLRVLEAKKLLVLRREPSDNFADNVFLTQFTKFRMQYPLLLITQDRRLSIDIDHLNDSVSVLRSYPVHVRRVAKNGLLVPHRWMQDPSLKEELLSGDSTEEPQRVEKPLKGSVRARRQAQSDRTIQPRKTHQETGYKFPYSTNITQVPDDQLPVQSIPTTGMTVFAVDADGTRTPYTLTEVLGAGGEGTVFRTQSELVAKIYHADHNTRRRMEKIKLLTAHPLHMRGICAPQKLLTNAEGDFVGYLMMKSQGLNLWSILSQKKLQRAFPLWKKADLVQLCITILERIRFLHEKNILLGDINLTNIQVVSPRDVYLVDCDSWQVGGFPCPVGQVNFTPPELQHRNFSTFLRTKSNEYFAVATMLFMCLMTGKTPYAHQGGGDPAENIMAMAFPYPYKESRTGQVPMGGWRFIWSHFSHDVKKAFWDTFNKDGEHCQDGKRLSVDHWLNIMRQYHDMLTDGRLARQDPMSLELFPNRFKRNPESTFIICKLCGHEVDERLTKEGYCNDCLNKRGDIGHCERCGKPIIRTNFQRYILKWNMPTMCPECREKERAEREAARAAANEVVERRSCVDCGQIFELRRKDVDHFQSHGLSLPKRCKACRDKKKNGFSFWS